MPIPENHLSVLARLAAQSVLPSARRLVAVSCLFQRGRLLTPSLSVYPQLLPFYPCGFAWKMIILVIKQAFFSAAQGEIALLSSDCVHLLAFRKMCQ